MRAQFSFEFVIDASFVILIVIFLFLFFANFTNVNQSISTMTTICNKIAQGINLVADSGGLSTVQYLNFLNVTTTQSYNISISNGIIIIYAVRNSAVPLSLVSNTNVVSCGANTRATANESFLLSNLAVYQNSSLIYLAYLSPNYTVITHPSGTTTYSSSVYPVTIDAGGFSTNASFSLTYPNGTTTLIAYEQQPFVYNTSMEINSLPSGNYIFSLVSVSNPSIYTNLPIAKT